MSLIEASKYGEYFHELYTNGSANRKVQKNRRLKQKAKKNEKRYENVQHEQNQYPSYSVAPNASKFVVYSAIRSAVLEADVKFSLFQENNFKKKKILNCCLVCAASCKANHLMECACHINDKKNREEYNSDNDSESEEITENEKKIAKVSQIVGAGVKSLFELIADARNVQPTLCTKALKALLDVIQGQHPESFKFEPESLINPLYDLLLDLSTLHGSITSGDNWSSIACSALLGLCIAIGDTGKILKVISALLMSPTPLSSQLIQLPLVLSSLQRTVICTALNKPTKPNLHSHGVPKNALIDQFSLSIALSSYNNYSTQPAITSDGKYLYLFISNILYKIGTGFKGTYKGRVYAMNSDFGKDKTGWLGFAGGNLYFKKLSRRSNESISIISQETLSIVGSIQINPFLSKEGQNFVLFSDGDSISAICTNKDDSLIVKQLYGTGSTLLELPLKLARKKFRTLGYAAFEDEVLNPNQIQKIQSSYNLFEPKLPSDTEIQGISCGKEFGLIRGSNGKVYFYGKPASLGLKSIGKISTMKMTELIISKAVNIIQVAIGHDGIHALLVNEDGTVYFTGTARRGEDGDISKNRRQPKATKPKKLSKIDGHVIVHAACNNGTSAFVTKTGKLIMFGKDTAHCDSLGIVTDLLDQHIIKVSLGKAHCVSLNSKGQIYTFGLNNKGQCGRVFVKEKEVSATEITDIKSSDQKSKLDFSNMCDFDEHVFEQEQCRVCSVCKECTGYNMSCVSSLCATIDERIAGTLCPCGHGNAGCSKCGACSACISLQEGETNDSKDPKQISLYNRQRSKNLILRRKDKKTSEENNPPSDVERDSQRVAPLSPQKVPLATANPIVQIACGLHHTVVLTLAGEVFTFGSNQYGQLGSGDLQPLMGPLNVTVQGHISQIAAGSNHTVLLNSKGIVYTFGNYQKGQLGRLPNDFQKHASNDDSDIEDIQLKDGNSTNSNPQIQKFLWNCTPGPVFGLGSSFGKKATWIGASGDQTFIKIDESLITTQMLSKINVVADKNTIMLIPKIPLSFHTLTINRQDGSCAAHYENQVNFVKMIQTNINMPEINQNTMTNNFLPNQDQISRNVVENRTPILDFQENYNVVDQRKRRKQEHKSFMEKIVPQIAFALDPHFDVLWVFDGGLKSILCYNVVASEIPIEHPDSSNLRAILSPELSLSQRGDREISRRQASLNLLACLDILTSTQDAIPVCFEQVTPQQPSLIKEPQKNEYHIVNRFESFGGGWGYSGHSVEAIRFMADGDILICGFGMFGGRGVYSCKLKLYDIGLDGGGYEKDAILLSETRDIPYECPARSKYHVMLPKPVAINAGRWYLVSARIAGPASDCGSLGQKTITTEDQIVFSFKSSKKSNNGTNVNSGQIPSILYQPITQESQKPVLLKDIDFVHQISKSFANTVTKECFDSLVSLLNWSWSTFKINLKESRDKTKQLQIKNTLENLVYVNKSCVRLLRKYINAIYPQKLNKTATDKFTDVNTPTNNLSKNFTNVPQVIISSSEMTNVISKKCNMESIQLAECIGNIRALIIQILCDEIFKDATCEDDFDMILGILSECHTSLVVCFDAFFPTSTLKWNCLCNILAQMDKGILHCRLLSAILAGLCNPGIELRSTFSLLTCGNERQSIISPSDNSGLPMLSSTEHYQYPILVEQMLYRTQQEKIDFANNSWTFKDVLVRLLDIIANPIKLKIENIYNRSGNFNELKYGKDLNEGFINNCCNLLARVLSEIVYQTSIADNDITCIQPKSFHSTGSRFARCDVSRTWNTGNFGSDAIAFTVDRPGIAIAGAMIYSGSGNYEYQLELLYDNTTYPQSHKWETLESISGSYDQEIVQNYMAEIKFDRPIHIKENARYALRLCSHGARTCSGDSGLASIRGPCGTTFTFFPCDLSFNGTTPARGQIPCILYYSTLIKNEGHVTFYTSESTARDTALQIATDITKKCTDLLILARNVLASSSSPSDKSPNSSNHTQIIDSEHNITPIEEHLDITWTNNSRNLTTQDANLSTARDITKRIESFSKGIIETLKFDKRSTNPFDFEIEIGATEILPKDLIDENDVNEKNFRNGDISKLNGNDRIDNIIKSDSEEKVQLTILQLLELFNMSSSHMFHTLLPLVFAHIGTLACSDPKSSVQILSLIKEILPHVAALNQLHTTKQYSKQNPYLMKENNLRDNIEDIEMNNKKTDEIEHNVTDTCTTSNHYCVVESEHPYKTSSINTYKVEFPPCVQWFTVEFDSQSGTAQAEDYLLLSIPVYPLSNKSFVNEHDRCGDNLDNMVSSRGSCKSACLVSSCLNKIPDDKKGYNDKRSDSEWIVIKKYNTQSNWSQVALILPGNKLEFSLETASFYNRDQDQANKYGFKCLVIGYDNPIAMNKINSCLIQLEYELSYLGGMCSANLMRKDLNLPDDKFVDDLSSIQDTLTTHDALLSKGLALSEPMLTINQALDSFLPVGSQSNERQFLKDFISGAPGSSGARLAAWLQPEPRLDPNKCELNPICEPVRYGWPTQLSVTIRDQYGDMVVVPDLKVEIKAIPSGAIVNSNKKLHRISYSDSNMLGGLSPPPRLNYEPTTKEKMCFKAITFMKPYSNYSFEELRFCSPIQARIAETLYAQDMEDGTFITSWTPNFVGSFCLTVVIDGIALEEIFRIEVKEGGIPPPTQKSSTKKAQPHNKLRKFVTRNSAGLRIRSHPTLQSEQVGIVKMNGIISFIDEIENDDGVWVRLSTESIRQHCTAGWYPTEAWCLEYNQHLGKTLLHPLVETQTTVKNASTKGEEKNNPDDKDSSQSPDLQLKSKSESPSKRGFDFSIVKFTPPLSMDSSKSSTNPFIFSSTKNVKIQNESPTEKKEEPFISYDHKSEIELNKLLDINVTDSSYEDQQQSLVQENSNQPNIGSTIAGVVGGGASKFQALQKWFRGDSSDRKDSLKKRSENLDVSSASVRDFVKNFTSQELKTNGNSTIMPSVTSSSPVIIPTSRYSDEHSIHSNSSKSTETTDTTILEMANNANLSDFNSTNIKLGNSSVSPEPVTIISSRNSPKKLRNTLMSSQDNLNEEISNLNVQLDQITNFHSSPPNFFEQNNATNAQGKIDPPKHAIPPSLAESLRAVFAAFLWHEGIVHDAMACASFLKFHPSLPKEGALVVTRRDTNESNMNLSREQKAQQRHSVEVANAGNYLNIRPSTLETLTKSGNSSINNRRYRKNNLENDNSDKHKLQSLPEVIAVLPPALRCLVYLWEQLSNNCIKIIQSSSLGSRKNSSGFRHHNTSKEKLDNLDKDNKMLRRKKTDDTSWCEFCDIYLPIPVTYHMRTIHSGCGKAAKGKGYNAVGMFCEGWAGNCGEGGKGASSWFLMCDSCREKYMSANKKDNDNVINSATTAISSNEANPFEMKTASLIANSELYTIMKENAIFLLELSSSTSSILTNQKKSPQQMPVVTEDQLNMFTDLNRPSTSRGDTILNTIRTGRVGLKTNGKFIISSSTPHRKSSVLPSCISPDLIWQAPETFSCLYSLGASMNDDLPYEIFGFNSAENCFERPVSEMSFDSCDQNNPELIGTSTTHASNTLSRFHRSFSMEQGWANQKNFPKNYAQIEDQHHQKIFIRRRNNSTSDEGSLLLCYPSENLRKLVPENILSTSCIVQSTEKIVSNEKQSDKANVNIESEVEAFMLKTQQIELEYDNNIGKKSPVPDVDSLLLRPAMAFIIEQHDLEKLRYSMKRCLRIATCRLFSLQAFNWLIKSVTQTVCLHDLMWWFVSSLSTSNLEDLPKGEELALEHPVAVTQMSGEISQVLSQSLHTFLQSIADLTLLLPGGSSLQRIAIQCFGIKFRQADHQFLHSTHVFGNISKILSKSDEQNEAMLISSTAAMVESNSHTFNHNIGNQSNNAKISNYIDLNGIFEITVSSREAMVDSLTDNSTETFWESDEEDRNKCKVIEISLTKLNYVCKSIFVHIDNSRDIQNKVLNMVFFAGSTLGDINLIKAVDIDSEASTWISARIPDDSYAHFRLELRGPENTLRVRQIKLLGLPITNDDLVSSKPNLKITNALQIQQKMCETETLRVFRLITGQVFGKLISTTDDLLGGIENSHNNPLLMENSATSLLADSLDLREHMVGILFSRSKLSHLQKQVIVHIVHVIRKETQRSKEEWEISNASSCPKDIQHASDHKSDASSERYRTTDTYCFEMLSMVLALSGSVVGRSYLSHQHGLLKDLLSLLHTGSDRVQRQVTALLRRILPEISPDSFGDLLGVQKMPQTDFNIVNQSAGDFDMNRLGILDIFLAVIAKSLQVQVKIKTTTKKNLDKTNNIVRLGNCIDFFVHFLKPEKRSNSTLDNSLSNEFDIKTKKLKNNNTKNLNQRWFLKGMISIKQAESIICLIRDMASGKLSAKWSLVTKAAIAESILNLTRLDEVFRIPENCIKTSTLWLALASLCVLDQEHVEKLSSGQWSKVSDTRPLCTNHDDGETSAIIQCEICGSLCGDCDRYLHLNRKTKNHKRTVCKEEEEAIRVELHESCGRTKLFWLLALSDSRTLKGMVEFRDGSNTITSGPQDPIVGRCRFCGVTGNSGLLEIGNVCADPQCQEHAANACPKMKLCNHTCGGVVNEQKCLPCLQNVCHDRENENAENSKGPKLTQDADDMCMICFVEALSCAPSIQLECGHVFHYHCCRLVLKKRWSGPRIMFGFSLCPICKMDIQHPLMGDILEPINALKMDVKRKALMRLKYEGVVKAGDNKDMSTYAMDRYAYYVCFKCEKAYFGGEARCDVEIAESFNPEELVCGGCSDVARAQMCQKHGTDFLEYKCRYCCSVAVFFCFGTTHFCDTCHDDFQRLTNIPRNKLPQCPAGPKAKQLLGEDCPLHIVHPPTGEEFALGCGVCRNAQTF